MATSQKHQIILVSFLLVLVLFTSTITAEEKSSDKLLTLIPSESIFCVRINNFDHALAVLDQFLTGASPMPMGASMMARMQLSGMLGDPALQGLNTAGDFVIFGTASEQSPGTTKEPDVFVAGLLPVKEYGSFIALSANVNEPDANGISKITVASMGGPAKTLVAAKAGQFALVASQKNYNQVLTLSKSISADKITSMSNSLESSQAKQAMEMPIWAYGNIQQINKAFGPFISKTLEQALSEISKASQMTGQVQLVNPTAIIKIYFNLIKAFLAQGKYASITVKPEPTVLSISKTVAAQPDTEMAELFTSDPDLAGENKLLVYLEDGAMVNIAAKINKTWKQKLGDLGLSFLKAMQTKTTPEEELSKWTQITKDGTEAMGNSLIISAKVDSARKPPFAGRYVVEIEDKEKFKEVFAKSSELMNTGSIADMYKAVGIQSEFIIEQGIAEYKGVSIDSAKFTIKATDPNSAEAQMLKNMYGDGFEYRMAHTDGLFITVISGNTDASIREVIDSIKTDEQKQLSSEVKTAMALLPEPTKADIVGTLNYIRVLEMIKAFTPMLINVPFDQIQTKSNVAFAGKAADGKLIVNVAVPKEHLTELTTGMMMMQQQMQQQMMQSQPNAPQP